MRGTNPPSHTTGINFYMYVYNILYFYRVSGSVYNVHAHATGKCKASSKGITSSTGLLAASMLVQGSVPLIIQLTMDRPSLPLNVVNVCYTAFCMDLSVR